MKKLGIMANCTKPRAADVLCRIAERSRELGLELFAGEETATLLGVPASASVPEMLEQCEAVMALGGDGTLLRVVRELKGCDRPVIGVNIGSLGFLTSVAEGDLDRALDCLAEGDFLMDTASIVDATVLRDGHEAGMYHGLNDIVITRGPSTRIATLDVSIDGDWVTSYVCDGLIVATAGGSTGHSLSAGGPIVVPGADALVLSLICPHTLSSRPLVIPAGSQIAVEIRESAGELLLAVDGQVGQPMREGDRLNVKRSARIVRLIRLPGYSYFAVLRQKLNWSGRNV